MSMKLINPLSLTNKLFYEESLDQTKIPTIQEEEAKSHNNSLDIIKPITTQFSDIPNSTEPVSLQTTDESLPHTNGNNLPSIVSQTQTGINNSYVDSNDEESPITMSSDGPQFDEIVKQLSSVFNDTNDYLSVELKSIIDHRSSNGVLEFKVEYINGDKKCHHIDVIKDKDPYATANYIMTHDLVTASNMTHGRWARLFLISLKRTLHRLRHSDFLGCEATSFNPSPTSKKQ